MIKQLHAFNPAAGFETFKIPPGKYKGFYLLIEGLQNGANAPTKAQMGWVRTIEQGRQKDLADLERLWYLDDIHFGIQEATMGGGDDEALAFCCYLPNFYPGDNINVWDIADIDNCAMELHTPSITTYADNLTYYVFGELQNGIEGYLSKLTNYDFVYAIGHNNENLKGFENIYGFLFENHADIDRIQAFLDNEFAWDATDDVIENATHLHGRMETFDATYGYLWLPMSLTGELENTLKDDVNLIVDTNAAGGSPSSMLIWSLDFPTAQKLNRSIATRQNNVNTRLASKSSQGKSRPIQTLKTLAVRR